jgi:hypothetical protein
MVHGDDDDAGAHGGNNDETVDTCLTEHRKLEVHPVLIPIDLGGGITKYGDRATATDYNLMVEHLPFTWTLLRLLQRHDPNCQCWRQ